MDLYNVDFYLFITLYEVNLCPLILFDFSSDEQKQVEEEKSKSREIYPGSPLHTSFDSISTQTTATRFQQPQAGNQDCFHLTTRFQEAEKKPNLGKERKGSTL